MKVSEAITEKVQATIPIDLQIQGAHLYDKTRRLVTGTNGKKIFVESPLPPVEDVELADIDLSNPFLYRQGLWQSYYERLRNEAPVHYQPNSPFGPFWSVTRHADIVTVEKNHEVFSSEPFIVIGSPPRFLDVAMFIAMDPPRHDRQRAAVQGVVAPKNLREMEGLIRSRVQEVLDDLPLDQPFDWVQNVSIELTARMLATLLDFPYEQRRKLVEWSDLATSMEQANGGPSDLDETFAGMRDMARGLSEHWHDKAARTAAGEEPGFDLITMLQSNESTKDLIKRPMEFLGNLVLLIVGGNDTTRNSMSGGVLALNRYPDQFEKLKANPDLIPNMNSEIIRWQTPLAYMRRIATADTMLNGQFIRKGDKVVMWYASGNRDERVFDQPDDFIIDRANARNHISFGFGVHRCMGNRLAELQLRILWEELLPRFENIEVVGEPEYVQSNFVRGISKLMVRLTPEIRRMTLERALIVGASHAGAQLSASLRQEGWTGEIVLVGDESALPYQRPPLSKAYLAGKCTLEELAIRSAEFYTKQRIQLLDATVEAVDRAAGHLSLSTGESLPYDRLALCTGARPRRLPTPGADLAGVFYLRTAADVEKIRDATRPGRRAVIVGGGYIGLETAASLRALGLEVTVLEATERVLERVTAPEVSAFFDRIHREEGVNIRTGALVEALSGDGRVREVVLAGGESIPADLVIVGIGVEPNTELAAAAGLVVDNGVVIDDQARTSDPAIVAAGDCVSHHMARYGRRIRLESVPSAAEQAKVAAATICGKSKTIAALPWFWSDQYDLKLQIAGLNTGYDEVVLSGDPTRDRDFTCFYLRAGELIAADCVNRPRDFMFSKRVITQQVPVDRAELVLAGSA